MAKGTNQKLKLLYLHDIFTKQTDQEHPLTITQITQKLAGFGISAERKSLYDDFEALRLFGLDIVAVRCKSSMAYFATGTGFEVPELRLLIDAVQASRSLTAKKTNELIEKLKQQVSVHEGAELLRQVYTANRPKAENESIYYSIGDIHTAIEKGRQINFNYFDWNEKKQKVFRHDNALYTVSPFALVWDDEHYYLLAFDEKANFVKHYRVDRMANVQITSNARDAQEQIQKFDPAIYTNRMFNMFGGDEETVTLRFKARLAGAMLDRFGMDITMFKSKTEGFFEISVNAVCSPQFYAWVFGFEGDVVISAPLKVAEAYKQMCKNNL